MSETHEGSPIEQDLLNFDIAYASDAIDSRVHEIPLVANASELGRAELVKLEQYSTDYSREYILNCLRNPDLRRQILSLYLPDENIRVLDEAIGQQPEPRGVLIETDRKKIFAQNHQIDKDLGAEIKRKNLSTHEADEHRRLYNSLKRSLEPHRRLELPALEAMLHLTSPTASVPASIDFSGDSLTDAKVALVTPWSALTKRVEKARRLQGAEAGVKTYREAFPAPDALHGIRGMLEINKITPPTKPQLAPLVSNR